MVTWLNRNGSSTPPLTPPSRHLVVDPVRARLLNHKDPERRPHKHSGGCHGKALQCGDCQQSDSHESQCNTIEDDWGRRTDEERLKERERQRRRQRCQVETLYQEHADQLRHRQLGEGRGG